MHHQLVFGSSLPRPGDCSDCPEKDIFRFFCTRNWKYMYITGRISSPRLPKPRVLGSKLCKNQDIGKNRTIFLCIFLIFVVFGTKARQIPPVWDAPSLARVLLTFFPILYKIGLAWQCSFKDTGNELEIGYCVKATESGRQYDRSIQFYRLMA